MSFKTLVYAYILGGFTLIPLLICAAVAWTIYTSVPVADLDPAKLERKKLSEKSKREQDEAPAIPVNDQAKPRKAWLTVRRTFEQKESDGSYVNMMRAYLDSRSKDPKRSRPKDMWYVVLKGDVLYLYEDETMTECEAAIHLSMHQVAIYPEGLADGELFTKRNAICLKPRVDADDHDHELPSVTREMGFEAQDVDKTVEEMDVSERKKEKERAKLEDVERMKVEAEVEAFDSSTPWFIFVRSCVEMEDWYLALVHAAHYSNSSSTLEPVRLVFSPSDMKLLVSTLDEQPDVIPMRWLNALLGRIFFSFYRTRNLESFIIGRLMKKLSKVKIPSFLQNVSVTEVSVGNTPPTFSKPMLKDLTKEGDAAMEVHVMYRGEVRVTVEATAIINLGQRFKTYTVKLVLAVVLRRLEGNLLVKVKRPPTNRIWYAFTQPPDMELDVEPVVSDRQIKWSMICSTIESRLKEIINESVVMPNMDDIAFFESSHLIHRGGIWADASRDVFRPQRSQEEQDETATRANGDLAVKKSRSTDVLAETVASTATEPMVILDSDRIETASAPLLSRDPTQRRSWFGNGSSLNDSESEASKPSPSDRPESPEDDRGRSLNVDTSVRRATSVPASKTPPAETSEPESSMQVGPETTAESSQDGSSSHSRIRSLSSGANALGQGNSSRESLPSRTSNTSSFLSTLRQKADKQVLSNTAKEAMKKWSANWNGFKREHMGGPSHAHHAEEPADGASGTTLSGSLFKGRNYADVRAAVAGRKDHGSSEDRRDGDSSRPIDFPTVGKYEDEMRNTEEGSSSESSKDVGPSSASPQSSPKAPALLRREAARAPLSPPSVTTDTTQFQVPEPASATSANFLSSPEPEVLPQPIKTQPSQGAMMTIPGIHASHRGDIQSYGYVPPALSSSTPPESKSRTPTIPPSIQSVYRLFRSPTANSSVLQQQQEQARNGQGSAATASPGESPRFGDSTSAPESNDDVTPLSLTPSVTDSPGTKTPVTSKPTPPPLPPRSPPARRPVPTPPQLPPRRDTGGASKTGETDVGIAPSASDALRAIAEQDETKRRDIEGSPELRPKANASAKTKRTSLGAKRISTPIAFSDEPESMHSDADAVQTGIPTEDASSQSSYSDRSSTPQAATSETTVKPKPPPLPPRRSSTLSSS